MRTSVRTSIVAVLCLTLAACGSPAVDRPNAPVAAAPGSARSASGAAPALAVAATTTPYCGITWGSGEKTAGPLSPAPLISVQTGRHDCWDRVVFEFNGTARGYSVRYSDQVPTDGEGLDLVPYTAGGAYLWVTLRAPAYDADHVSTIDARTGDHTANVVRYATLRDVVFGGSFEGYTTFAVGVRARLPFRVTLLTGPGTHSRIVVDIAHRW
ncbi:hypothetical protein EV385_5806 [Krasilnikovia cinnamomea]|uniref:AMIN-like domain-containing protein n=1 Tax=Krasilnikovia cinnamomea TaxID=349313 RepID=A0A4Q7ZRU5_9ACTN|nr:hypothetical protein [Krasilnikovia cinnamomea]RZU53872.1 hypothetical protein EV385_5806 [Krasilnikovia cinnamomea]